MFTPAIQRPVETCDYIRTVTVHVVHHVVEFRTACDAMEGLITSRCSGKQAQAPLEASSRGGTKTRLQRVAEIEPNEMGDELECHLGRVG